MSRSLISRLCLLLSFSVLSGSICAGPRSKQPERNQQQTDRASDKAKKKADKRSRKSKKTENPDSASSQDANENAEEMVEVTADRQSKDGDLFVYEGYVTGVQGEDRLQADRVTLNNATGDMVAEGNVIFDQGPDQRVTAGRAELNWVSHRGTFWDTTGFTNRTQTGEYIFYTAARVIRTGDDTYEMFDAVVTACEDVVPKWTFKSRHAELKLGDRLILHNAVFRVKTLAAFAMPYMWIPATRKERKSGFLLPNTGSSNQKGRTLKTAYYQTLGDSADITFRGDLYSQRGLGFGAEFRAQTGEKSYLRLGVFTVKDRLFGPAGEDDGGTAVVGEGVQYLPHGWLAVGNLSLVTSLQFRQIFSDDISQVIDPRRESQFYANNNARGLSLNFLASEETTALLIPSANPSQSASGGEVDVAIRQAPELDLTVYPRRIWRSLPIYFSVDSSTGALKREETTDQTSVLVTPAAVQRLDIQPKITVPLATIAGIAVTPSLSFRETFYTSAMDPSVPSFDPNKYTLNPADPRLDPASPQFVPGLMFYDRTKFDPIIPKNVSRRYAELAVDIRPPALEKTFYNQDDGSAGLRHVIEPYITYRRIDGIGQQFDSIIRFDERDAVANTNELEYALVNRFFIRRSASDVVKRRSRTRPKRTTQFNPVRPKAADTKPPDRQASPESSAAPSDQSAEQKKQALEQGQKAEMQSKSEQRTTTEKAARRERAAEQSDESVPSNVDEPDQPHELLVVRVAQKYFFDRDFGGALVEGQRNQFYPMNTLSGFTFGGVKREFSPVNVSMRYRPLASVYADLRMDIDASGDGVRSLTIGGGVRTDKVNFSTRYDLSRRIDLDPARFEAGTFPGNQIVTTLQLGDDVRGLYGGTRIGYDFTDRLISQAAGVSKGRLRNSRSYIGYSWGCCGVQLNYNTFKAGLRNESAFSFSFTLAGLGSFGSDQFSQLGGGSGGRRRGRRAKGGDDELP